MFGAVKRAIFHTDDFLERIDAGRSVGTGGEHSGSGGSGGGGGGGDGVALLQGAATAGTEATEATKATKATKASTMAVTKAASKAATRAAAASRWVRIEGAGHWLHTQRPVAVEREMRAFLAAVQGGAAKRED